MTEREINEKAAALLRAASTYVLKGHVRKVNARKADGAMCDPESNQAVCWCAQGAMYAAFGNIGLRFPDRTQLPRTRQADLWINKRQRVIERAKDTLNVVAEIPEDSGGIPTWNDEIVEDGVEVAGMMVAAAEKLEAAA